ncbi:hypothetical protein [Salinisphaera aquimarina]|uniref:Motility protein n=1 Tax=Salinisphaera aquimarina TaxID=2094031 RepID=A0ABV7EKH4_9GAMM
MDAGSVSSTVATAMALQQHNQSQDAQASLLKDTLENQAAQMNQLMSSVQSPLALATVGPVGTQINTSA